VGDRAVLLITFALTVLVDLTVAIEVGVVLAAVLFMHRMSEAVEVQADLHLVEEDVSDESPRDFQPMREYDLPPGVAASLIRGPFFFGVAMRLGETLERIGAPPKVLIVRLRAVPVIDATGVTALETMIDRCEKNGTKVIFTALQPQPARVLAGMHVLDRVTRAPDFATAIEMAKEMMKEG
jgi:SulP family sulfate permease